MSGSVATSLAGGKLNEDEEPTCMTRVLKAMRLFPSKEEDDHQKRMGTIDSLYEEYEKSYSKRCENERTRDAIFLRVQGMIKIHVGDMKDVWQNEQVMKTSTTAASMIKLLDAKTSREVENMIRLDEQIQKENDYQQDILTKIQVIRDWDRQVMLKNKLKFATEHKRVGVNDKDAEELEDQRDSFRDMSKQLEKAVRERHRDRERKKQEGVEFSIMTQLLSSLAGPEQQNASTLGTLPATTSTTSAHSSAFLRTIESQQQTS